MKGHHSERPWIDTSLGQTTVRNSKSLLTGAFDPGRGCASPSGLRATGLLSIPVGHISKPQLQQIYPRCLYAYFSAAADRSKSFISCRFRYRTTILQVEGRKVAKRVGGGPQRGIIYHRYCNRDVRELEECRKQSSLPVVGGTAGKLLGGN